MVMKGIELHAKLLKNFEKMILQAWFNGVAYHVHIELSSI